MRYGICVPNLGQFADPRQVGELARRAEEAGWDGFFVWDHVVFPYGELDVVTRLRDAPGLLAGGAVRA
jgi:alkanesulfonate monooxygenase SsuD/methylene tetrahydromethanopterin reductase-like flavin-dependent oxidoreductase (luciferase family)